MEFNELRLNFIFIYSFQVQHLHLVAFSMLTERLDNSCEAEAYNNLAYEKDQHLSTDTCFRKGEIKKIFLLLCKIFHLLRWILL